MSEAKCSTGALTRRGFIKGAGAAVGIAGLAGVAGMTATSDWLAPAAAHAEPEERVAYAFHQFHCGGHCSLRCSVRDGRLCLVEPNDAWEDKSYQTCCLKGISEVQHVYSEERIQTPLKRVGERGSRQYVSISWDEALSIFKEEIEKLWEKYGHQSVFVHTTTEAAQTYPFLASILRAQTGGFGGIDMGIGNGFDPSVGSGMGTTDALGENPAVGTGYLRPTSEARDMVNSKFILNVGNNFLETSLVQSSLFFDAQDSGARIVTIDPHFSTTAQKSDEWVPIEPGTDAALYLGMVSVILDEGLFDEEFVVKRTGLPFLVSTETGELLTSGKLLEEGNGGSLKHPGDYMVWDEDKGRAMPHDAEGVTPSIRGEYSIDGVVYETVFDRVVANQAAYDLVWASDTTGIPQEKIRELAVRYATSGASAICTGYGGNDKMTNADIAGHAAALLVSLTGNIGKPGAFIGGIPVGGWGYMALLGNWKLPDDLAPIPAKTPAYNLRSTDNEVRGYVVVGDAIHLKMANLSATERWLNSLDFICVIDMYHTTATDYADLILPASTKFESEERIGGIKAWNGHVLLREKVLDPLFESKSDFRIQQEIAKLFGVEAALPASCEEWVAARLEQSVDETIAGITIDSLLEHQGVQAQSCQGEYRRAYVDRFGTPSGKMEIYYQNLMPYGQALPVWEECSEVFAGNSLRETYPLQFVQVRTKYRIHSQFFDSSWVNQFSGVFVEMNESDMASRSIVTGDVVEIYNNRGLFQCEVRANPAVRPGCVRVHEGIWNRFAVKGGFQYLTNDHQEERGEALIQGPVIPFNDTLVEVKKA